MKPTLVQGLTLSKQLTVDAGRCITFMGQDAMVYATPSMVNDMEHACLDVLAPHLDAGESSVGTHVSIDHLAPTPLGMQVRIDVKLARIEKRGMTFGFSVHDGIEEVGRGSHTRFVVDGARTRERLTAKRAKAGLAASAA